MFNIFNWFAKEEEDAKTAEALFGDNEPEDSNESCTGCPLGARCKDKKDKDDSCRFATDISCIDFSKEVMLLIDDNEGMISFLEDDIEFLKEEGLAPEDLQILSISGNFAAYNLEILMKKTELKIDYAIIDITLGGSIQTKEGIVKYTGVEVFEMIYNKNKDAQYVFYTGNNLNPYIKSNKVLIDKYNKISSLNIKDSVLFKTSLDMDDRRKYIFERFFKK